MQVGQTFWRGRPQCSGTLERGEHQKHVRIRWRRNDARGRRGPVQGSRLGLALRIRRYKSANSFRSIESGGTKLQLLSSYIASYIARMLFEKHPLWSVGVYRVNEYFGIRRINANDHLIFLLNSKKLDIFGRMPHTYADPFLFNHGGELYLFYEIVDKGGRGEIAAYRSKDLKQFENVGVVLRSSFHLSFPFVFEYNSEVYMIPESHQAGEVALYQFENFPFGLKKLRALLEGVYVDSHLLWHEGHWFLFTTFGEELHIYVAEDLFNSKFFPHPRNPISRDLRRSRSAGAVFRQDGRLYRVAQDCSVSYGGNIGLHEIIELSPVTYRESMAVEQLFAVHTSWNSLGTHHFSICEFNGATIVAIDGKQADYYANRFASIWRTLARGFARRACLSLFG